MRDFCSTVGTSKVDAATVYECYLHHVKRTAAQGTCVGCYLYRIRSAGDQDCLDRLSAINRNVILQSTLVGLGAATESIFRRIQLRIATDD